MVNKKTKGPGTKGTQPPVAQSNMYLTLLAVDDVDAADPSGGEGNPPWTHDSPYLEHQGS